MSSNKERAINFNLKYNSSDYSYSFILYTRNESFGICYRISFSYKIFTAQECISAKNKNPEQKWQIKPESRTEKYYIKDFEFGDIFQLQQMMNNLTRFLDHDVIEFNQKLFSEHECNEFLKDIVRHAVSEGIFARFRLPVPKEQEITRADKDTGDTGFIDTAVINKSDRTSEAQSTGASDRHHAYSPESEPSSVHSQYSSEIRKTASAQNNANEKEGIFGYLLGFKGKVNRSQFIHRLIVLSIFYPTLIILCFSLAISGILSPLGITEETINEDGIAAKLMVMYIVSMIALYIVGLEALMIRRCRDIGITGCITVVLLFTPLNLILLCLLMIIPGKPEKNANQNK